MALSTFGYEGLSIGDFISRLKSAGVEVVLDVRQMPLSRKKGFSKTAFRSALQDAGIAYEHLRTFGCPRPIRDRYKIDGDWARYKKDFNVYLEDQSDAVAELARLVQTASACLVCFEADFGRCHRSLVTEAVARKGGPRAIHLTAKAETSELLALIAA